MEFLTPQAYLQSLNSRTLSLLTTAAQNLHQCYFYVVSAMLSLLAKTMCGRTQLTMQGADPEEVAGVRTPASWKITNTICLNRNMQLDPLHLGKVGPPGNVRAPFSMEYRKVII